MIYICDDINLDYQYEELEKYVSLERKVKAFKYVERIDYALSLLAYCLLKVGIYKETGIVLSDNTAFVYYAHNKPKIEGVNKHFNMSHCHKCVAAVIEDNEVGIDVESSKNVTDNLIKFTMNKNEIENIKKDQSYFYRYWTNKESYLKLTGKGIDVILTSLDLSPYKGNNFDFKDIHFYCDRQKEYSISACSEKHLFAPNEIIKYSFNELIKELESME